MRRGPLCVQVRRTTNHLEAVVADHVQDEGLSREPFPAVASGRGGSMLSPLLTG
jgi:hypothetical protein